MSIQEHRAAGARKNLAAIFGALVIGFMLGHVAGSGQPDELEAAAAVEADRQDAEAQASRDWALSQLCPDGTSARWVSDKDFVCERAARQVAAK